MTRTSLHFSQLALLLAVLGCSFGSFGFFGCAKPEKERSETPQAQFLFQERDVSFPSIDIIKAGTLAMPEGEGPFPAVVLLSPSLPNDRDITFGGLTFFKDFAEYLASKGIAVLRTDDRGVGESTGSYFDSTLLDFSDDAIAAVHFLQSIQRIRRDEIGLVGLSEGGAVGPLSASRSEDVAFVVMMAGPGLPYRGSMLGQIEDLGNLYGDDTEDIRKLQAAAVEMIGVINENTPPQMAEEKIKAALLRLRDQDIESPAQRFMQASLEDEVALMLTPWLRSQAIYDPAPALIALKVPLLAITGELDPILSAERHLPSIRRLMAESKSLDTSFRPLPGHNHIFQKTKTGKFEEYLSANATFSHEALGEISNWILVRFPVLRVP
jgi:hypothetical protein